MVSSEMNVQRIVEKIRKLPREELSELDSFIEYLRFKTMQSLATLEPREPEIGLDRDGSHDELAEEQEAWFARSAAERRHYAADYVAVRQGEVVDHDPDQRTLYLRVRARYGRTPVLIVPATWDQPPVLTFRSPRLDQ